MGVYIKGMEMPTSCWDCPMVSGYEIADKARTICSTVRCRLTNTKRPVGEAIAPDCPLVPVPPHGRLGDLDELYASLKKWLIQNRHSMTEATRVWIRGVLEGIAAAPTILPAEEGEK